MKSPEELKLERAALSAHAAGLSWATFWQEHGAAVCRAEPHDKRRFARLVRKLLALVSAGDTDGMDPVGDSLPPWEIDDQPSPDDTETAARCQLTFPLWPLPWEPAARANKQHQPPARCL